MAVVTADDAEWLGQLRDIIAALFREGPASYGAGTKVGVLLASYDSAVGKFDEAYEPLVTSAALHRDSLDAAADHLSVVAHAFDRFLHTAPRLRAINARLPVQEN